MKKMIYPIQIFLFSFLILSLLSCEDLDVYDYPKETLTGSIVDKNTGNPIETEQPNGIRVRLEEISWSETPAPLYFWVKPDGTFQNTKVFTGTYIVTPVDGPYFPVEGVTVDIKGGKTNIDFEVEPFLNLEIVSIDQNGSNFDVNFRISRSSPSFKITDARVFISATRFASNGTYLSNKSGQILSPSISFASLDDEQVLAQTHTLSVVGLEGGNRTYYLRVGARTNDNVQKRYNYAAEQIITVP